jgi:hypothetical protein
MTARRCPVRVTDAEGDVRACGAPATATRTVEGIILHVCDACAATVDAAIDDPEATREPARDGADGGKGGRCPESARLDWSDAAMVSNWLASLRQSLDDADGVVLDMLKPPHLRELGPALHAQKYDESRAQILHALDFATAPEPDEGEPNGDESGGQG